MGTSNTFPPEASHRGVHATSVGFAMLLALGCAPTPSTPSPVQNDVPVTEVCSADAGPCLFGTATAVGFSGSPVLSVNLYQVFPFGSFPLVQQQLVASAPVAADGTWALSARNPGGHYYVQLVATVQATPSATPRQASTLIGPLAAPSGQAQALRISPIYASALQSNAAGGAQEINEVSAQVYDAVTGDAVIDASVSIAAGDASVTLLWDPGADPPSYRATFEAGTPAQATYTVSSSSWDGAAQLVAPTPTPVGAITSPEAGATFDDEGGTLSIDWAQEPSDFEVVELFAQSDGGWAAAYVSHAAIPPGVDNTGSLSSEGVDLDAGTYLVNVVYVRANCVATGGGCVQAGSIATESFTVTP
jgi:hypothetical protein